MRLRLAQDPTRDNASLFLLPNCDANQTCQSCTTSVRHGGEPEDVHHAARLHDLTNHLTFRGRLPYFLAARSNVLRAASKLAALGQYIRTKQFMYEGVSQI